jgi:hypothetical protein
MILASANLDRFAGDFVAGALSLVFLAFVYVATSVAVTCGRRRRHARWVDR